jgi:hypothetical protein
MKRLDASFGSREPREPHPPSLFNLISLTVDKPTHCRVGVGAIVHKHRLAQRQARQVKGKRENRYVIKVMNEHREGGLLISQQPYSKVVLG